jgi:protein-disulfide isomerase
MASRKEQKEQARARRLAEEQARAQRTQRQRRLQIIGGVVLVAVIVVAVAIAISSGGGKSESGLQRKGTAQQSKTVAAVSSLLTGIPQSGAVLGSPKAPVTMTYYGDLECPICQEFTLQGGFSQLVSNDVRQGRVKVVYKAFQTATRDPNVFKTQQVAALAAGLQNKFWDFAELFYHEQGQEDTGYVTESYLDGLAQQVPGLSLSKWESDRNNAALASQVQSDMQEGIKLGVSGTPTLVFTGPKGQSVPSSSVPSYSDLEQSVKKVA